MNTFGKMVLSLVKSAMILFRIPAHTQYSAPALATYRQDSLRRISNWFYAAATLCLVAYIACAVLAFQQNVPFPDRMYSILIGGVGIVVAWFVLEMSYYAFMCDPETIRIKLRRV